MADAHTGMTIAGALALAGCTTMADGGSDVSHRSKDTCRAEPGQRFLAQRATAETGAAIIAATRSSTMRWVPPDTIVTTEYAYGRVTVAYDEEYRIMQVSCG